ncbi:MAG: DUF2182 domain-containing protein [Actinomycetota bacterium]
MSMAEAVPIPMFVLMWTAMMAAMMLPSVAPVALMWVRSIGSSSTKANRLGRNLLFISGYLGVWGSLGLVAYAGGLGMSMLSNAYPQRSKWIVAGLFLTSGIYQLTPFKNACLRHCRSPMSQLMGYAALKGAWRDLRVGLHHGLYCVGCCWGIMLVLIVVGTMNLLAAAGLAVVIFLEKSWTRGPLIAKMFGLALIGLGIVTLFTPMTALQFAMSL